MGNACCTPTVSGSGRISRQNSSSESVRPSAEEPRRSSSSHANATPLPISPRRSSSGGSEESGPFNRLPGDLQHHIGSLLPRTGRSALRQASQTLHQALPRGERDVMHSIEGVHALLGINPGTPNDEVSLAIGRAIHAAQNHSGWTDRGRLLVAARHAVQPLQNHPDRAQLLLQIESAIQNSGLSAEQWRRTDAVFAQMVNARANA